MGYKFTRTRLISSESMIQARVVRPPRGKSKVCLKVWVADSKCLDCNDSDFEKRMENEEPQKKNRTIKFGMIPNKSCVRPRPSDPDRQTSGIEQQVLVPDIS